MKTRPISQKFFLWLRLQEATMTRHRRGVYRHLVLPLLSILVCTAAGCISPKSLRPVAQQNYDNIAALSQNTTALLTLYEKYFAACTESLITLHIARVRDGLTWVVGRPDTPPKDGASWEELFKGKTPYVDQRDEIISVRKQPNSKARQQELMLRHGWIYLTVADPQNFTPQKAHELVQSLANLAADSTINSNFLQEEENILRGSDPTLDLYRKQIEAAKLILTGLKEALARQVNFADSHSRAILAYSQTKVDIGKAVGGILGSEEVKGTLEELAKNYVKDETLRKGAIELLVNLPGILSF